MLSQERYGKTSIKRVAPFVEMVTVKFADSIYMCKHSYHVRRDEEDDESDAGTIHLPGVAARPTERLCSFFSKYFVQ